jgi:hypothetical protein
MDRRLGSWPLSPWGMQGSPPPPRCCCWGAQLCTEGIPLGLTCYPVLLPVVILLLANELLLADFAAGPEHPRPLVRALDFAARAPLAHPGAGDSTRQGGPLASRCCVHTAQRGQGQCRKPACAFRSPSSCHTCTASPRMAGVPALELAAAQEDNLQVWLHARVR